MKLFSASFFWGTFLFTISALAAAAFIWSKLEVFLNKKSLDQNTSEFEFALKG